MRTFCKKCQSHVFTVIAHINGPYDIYIYIYIYIYNIYINHYLIITIYIRLILRISEMNMNLCGLKVNDGP